MSRLSDARTALAEALRTEGVLPEWRVHDTPPETIAAPCAWIDLPAVSLTELGSRGAKTLVATWQVVLIVDGGDPQQVAQLDEGAARLWDALDGLALTDATALIPQPFDVGGPRLRGVILTVDVTLLARSLCPPAQLTSSIT